VRLGDVWDNQEAAEAFAAGFLEATNIRPDIVALRERSSEQRIDPRLIAMAGGRGRLVGAGMKQRGELSRSVRVIVSAVRQVGAAVVAAIRKASADAREDRDVLVMRVAGLLRNALQEGATRAVVVNPGTGRSVAFTANDGTSVPGREPAPTTPPDGPANDDEPPPESGPPPDSTPRWR
jgi:hypothetical protein